MATNGFVPAFGLNSWATNIQNNNMGLSNHMSLFNNGSSRLSFNVRNALPGYNIGSNFQGQDFNHFAFLPIMQFTGQNGLNWLPLSFQFTRPDMIPTMSALTNWGGNNRGY